MGPPILTWEPNTLQPTRLEFSLFVFCPQISLQTSAASRRSGSGFSAPSASSVSHARGLCPCRGGLCPCHGGLCRLCRGFGRVDRPPCRDCDCAASRAPAALAAVWNDTAYLNRGWCSFEHGMARVAAAHVEKAIALERRVYGAVDFASQLRLASVQSRLKQHTASLRSCRAALLSALRKLAKSENVKAQCVECLRTVSERVAGAGR